MKFVVWGLVLLLVVIHQDVWNWSNDRLVFGFLPVTLAYHACISLGAGIAWFLAINFAWPDHLDEDDTSMAVDLATSAASTAPAGLLTDSRGSEAPPREGGAA